MVCHWATGERVITSPNPAHATNAELQLLHKCPHLNSGSDMSAIVTAIWFTLQDSGPSPHCVCLHSRHQVSHHRDLDFTLILDLFQLCSCLCSHSSLVGYFTNVSILHTVASYPWLEGHSDSWPSANTALIPDSWSFHMWQCFVSPRFQGHSMNVIHECLTLRISTIFVNTNLSWQSCRETNS